MSQTFKRLILCSLVSALAVACSDAQRPEASVADVGQHEDDQNDVGAVDAGRFDTDQPDSSQPDSSQPDAHVTVPSSYTSIFADPQSDRLFVTYQQQSGVRLFEFDEGQAWSEVDLPESLHDTPQVRLTSVVSTEFDVLLSTEAHGAWRWLPGEAQWQPFAPEWFDSAGRITHLRKLRDQIFAFHEVTPHVTDGIELWQRRQLDWEFIRNDMFMIIDYMPRDEFLLRATRYGTVESSTDAGQSWQLVPGVIGALPPRIFEWGEDVAVATTNGVWITRDDAHSWEQLSDKGGQAAALVDDEIVVAGLDGQVLAVRLDDGSTRELASLPASPGRELQLAVSGETLIVANHGPELFSLPLEPASSDPSQWQRIDPAQ